MSGPIVRKYGFPNFDKIFGKREEQHGTDDPGAVTAAEQIARAAGADPRKDDPKPQGESGSKPAE